MLKIAPCTYLAAKYACEKFHYSKSVPAGKLVKYGVWENNQYIGCVIYGRGANKNLADSFGLKQTECVELCRIALRKHQTPVSRIIAISLKELKRNCAGVRLVVSYADTAQGHLGKVYQASNWIYLGTSYAERVLDPRDGEWKHPKTMHSLYGSIKGFTRKKSAPKHKYAYCLDATLKERIARGSLAYPHGT